MKRIKLLQTAEKLFPVSSEAVNEYREKRDIVLYKMNQAMLERSDIIELVGGKKNISMMKDNHANHLKFICSIMKTPDPEILVDTIVWVFIAYMSRGFHSTYWPAQINTWVSIFKENFSEKTFLEISSLYEWISINIPVFESLAAGNYNNITES